MAPEVVAARIVLRVAELRLLAAWTSVLACRERLPEAQGRAASVGSAAQLLAASRPLRSYIRFTSKADVIAKFREVPQTDTIRPRVGSAGLEGIMGG